MTKVPQNRPRYGYFIALDLVRFLAAVLVVGLHLGVWAWWRDGVTIGTIAKLYPGYPHFPELLPFLWFGWVGVQIFFVISGLVITISAEKSNAGQFFRSRFLRLYPGVWICATLSLVIIACSQGGLDSETGIRYLNSLIIGPYPRWIDGVYWTLVVELVFYAGIFALIAFRVDRHIVSVGICYGLASSLYIIGLNLGLVPSGWIFTLLLLRHGVFFATGMLLWFIFRNRQIVNKVFYLVLVTFTGACLLEIVYTANEKRLALGLDLAVSIWPPVIVWLAIMILIAAIVIFSDAFNRVLTPLAAICRILGLATFPLYLTHQIVGGSVATWAYAAGLSRYGAFAWALTASVTASIMIAIKMEPALRRCMAHAFDYWLNRNKYDTAL
jgi:peptidoglycan/LPS O-acetylase OafA/YrhL